MKSRIAIFTALLFTLFMLFIIAYAMFYNEPYYGHYSLMTLSPISHSTSDPICTITSNGKLIKGPRWEEIKYGSILLGNDGQPYYFDADRFTQHNVVLYSLGIFRSPII